MAYSTSSETTTTKLGYFGQRVMFYEPGQTEDLFTVCEVGEDGPEIQTPHFITDRLAEAAYMKLVLETNMKFCKFTVLDQDGFIVSRDDIVSGLRIKQTELRSALDYFSPYNPALETYSGVPAIVPATIERK